MSAVRAYWLQHTNQTKLNKQLFKSFTISQFWEHNMFSEHNIIIRQKVPSMKYVFPVSVDINLSKNGVIIGIMHIFVMMSHMTSLVYKKSPEV